MFTDHSASSDPINNFLYDPVQVVVAFWTLDFAFQNWV